MEGQTARKVRQLERSYYKEVQTARKVKLKGRSDSKTV
jgi:hypothetical protein